MRGLKQVVRSYIRKTDINLYTDTFQLLVKYDDHYVLENVCTDIYQKCVKSIADKCAVDSIEFSNYVEEIIGDDLVMKNIVLKKLTAEFADLNKEYETKDELSTLKRRLDEIDTREAKKFCEMKELLAATDKKIINVQKTDQEGISKIDSLTKSVAVLQQKLSKREKEIAKCSNCKYFDCKHEEEINLLSVGMKVKVSKNKHACKAITINGISKDVVIPADTDGLMKEDLNIEFHLKSGKIIISRT